MLTPNRLWFAVALVAVGLTANQSRADIVVASLSSNPLSPSDQVNIGLAGSVGQFSYTPGVVNWNGTSQSTSSAFQHSFISFCIELTQDINPGTTYTYNVSSLANAPVGGTMGAWKATEIEKLWGGFFNSVNSASLTQAQRDINAAAFQLDIWKIEYDWTSSSQTLINSSGSSSPGNTFYANGNSAVTTQANLWLAQLKQNPNAYTAANLEALTNSNYQDQVVAVPLPVPPGYALAGVGALCLCGFGIAKARSRILKPIAV
jgi:hypothetical protein